MVTVSGRYLGKDGTAQSGKEPETLLETLAEKAEET
jgi:hypothetical protein